MLFRPFSKLCLLSLTFITPAAQAQIFDKPLPFSINEAPLAETQPATVPMAEALSQTTKPVTLADILAEQPRKGVDVTYDLIEKGLYGQAKTLVDILKTSPYSDAALYAEALIQAQLGQFESAYTILTSVQPIHFDIEVISEQQNILALLIAQRHLNAGNVDESRKWMRRFVGNTATTEDRAQFSRIFTGIETLTSPTEAERLRVGLLVPQSGPLASVGKDVYNAAKMALFERKMRSIYIYPHDTAGRAEGATNAAEFAFRDGAQVLLGPLLAENTKQVQDVARYNRAPVIAFSSLRHVADRNTFLLSYIPDEQAERIATYAADQGVKKVATLVPNTPYGQLMHDAFSKKAASLDIQVVRSATFTPGAADHTLALKELAQIELAKQNLADEQRLLEQEYALVGEAMNDVSLTRYREIRTVEPEAIVDFDALFVPASAQDLPLLASQLAFYDMDASQITLLGTGQWQDQSLYKERQEYTRGAYFPASGDAQQLETFNLRFEQAYGYIPHPLAILGYDAVQLIADVYNSEGGNVEGYTDSLSRREGFSLVSGPIRFSRQGTPERVYNIHQVGRRSSRLVQSAPSVMPPALPQPVNPLEKQSGSVFDFFEGWGF